ncbi:MAG: DNA repair protein RadA, partial [Clostridia bacterium]|nr:DNA repair protein RadA [Clostridia bacterium]
MKSPKTAFVCTECEYRTLKWMGKCPSCGSWNTLEEVVQEDNTPTSAHTTARRNPPVRLDEYDMPEYMRYETGY